MEASAKAELKRKIKREAKKLGINLIGFANVERWSERAEIDPAYYPQTIWPWSKTVISLAVQIYLPMIETTPSVVYSELYNTTNRFLDESAYRLANFLNGLGYRAHFFPRDCYGDISVLVKKPEAAFSHVLAGKYAGLGTIGMNHTLLTKEYGPRIRLVSVITDAEITPDPMQKRELCIQCKLCAKNCPMQAFTANADAIIAEMDKYKCAEYHQKLKNEFRYPCGVCTAVCPVGADRKIYGKSSVSDQGIAHCQNFGSKNAVSG
ncbi:MAG: 4Fe-4S dicluster domain-containing protein [Clostridia bacterium]|nr:4Fe-4S dicluster domain-containing protein [Clostridia bacterium]